MMAHGAAEMSVFPMMVMTLTRAIAASRPRPSVSTDHTEEIIATSPSARAEKKPTARLEKNRRSARTARAEVARSARLQSPSTAFPRFKAGS